MPLLAQSVAELAQSASMRSATEWFRKERAWINEQHLTLCRIPAPTFFEQKRAEWMAERFRSLGWNAKLDRAGNVIASLPGGSDAAPVAVTAHLDTVLAPRSVDDIKVMGDGRLSGPGVSDNGAGLTALLALAAVWTTARPVEDPAVAPVLVANVGEEGEGNLSGMRYLCHVNGGQFNAGQLNSGGRLNGGRINSGRSNGDRFRAFLVLDGPSLEHITCQALASRRFDVTITGPGGHSWSDYGVGNPVHALSRAVTIFTDEAASLGLVSTGSVPKSSFNFGVIEGGSSINSIPSEARAKVDLRSESPGRIDGMAALLASALERALEVENARSAGGRVAGRIKEIGSRPGGSLAADAPILEFVRAVDAHLGIRSHLDCSSTDANIPLSLGLPAVSIGAGGQGGGAHTAAEWFQPDGRELGLKRILLALGLLFG